MRGSLNTAAVRSCEAHPTQTITHARPARPPHLHRALVHSRLLLVVQPARGTVIRAASGERQPRGGDAQDAQRCKIPRRPTRGPPGPCPCWRTCKSHPPSQACEQQPAQITHAAPNSGLPSPVNQVTMLPSQTHEPPAQAMHRRQPRPLTWACPRRRTPGSQLRTPRPPQTQRPPPVNRSGG